MEIILEIKLSCSALNVSGFILSLPNVHGDTRALLLRVSVSTVLLGGILVRSGKLRIEKNELGDISVVGLQLERIRLIASWVTATVS